MAFTPKIEWQSALRSKRIDTLVPYEPAPNCGAGLLWYESGDTWHIIEIFPMSSCDQTSFELEYSDDLDAYLLPI